MSYQKSIQNQGLVHLLKKLSRHLSDKASKVQKISEKVQSIDSSMTTQPHLIKKMARWLRQLSNLEHEEKKILSHITALERKHQDQRTKKMVRFARKGQALKNQDAASPQNKKTNWLLWLMIYDAFFSKKSKKKTNEYKL